MNGRSDEGAGRESAPEPTVERRERRRYHPPRLTCYGALVDLTLGGSPGVGDSGGGGLVQNPLV